MSAHTFDRYGTGSSERLPSRRSAMKLVGAAGAIGLGLQARGQTSRPAPQPARRTRGSLGLALGAGSARGFAHIGVLKSLDQAGITPDLVCGTSAGALVGAFYSYGLSPWAMEEIALKVKDGDVLDLQTANKRGMFAGEALQRTINAYCKNARIEGMKTPFGAVTTNLRSGNLRLLRTGDLGLAVRASCAIPGIFVPAMIDGQEHVDGGLTSPLPVNEARSMGAGLVIAVDVGSNPQHNVSAGLYEVILQSFDIMGRALTDASAKQADIVIRPDIGRFSSSDFNVRREMIQAGYEATQKLLPDITAKLASIRR